MSRKSDADPVREAQKRAFYRQCPWEYSEYAHYLRSSHWRRVRDRTRQRAGYACEACGSTDQLQVHHLTYERLGAEHDSDLQLLCQTCHQEAHDEWDPFARYEQAVVGACRGTASAVGAHDREGKQ